MHINKHFYYARQDVNDLQTKAPIIVRIMHTHKNFTPDLKPYVLTSLNFSVSHLQILEASKHLSSTHLWTTLVSP
jgi:hypothetical protein